MFLDEKPDYFWLSRSSAYIRRVFVFLKSSRLWVSFCLSAIVVQKQVISLINSLRDAVGDKVPILIDQEGGRVQRLSPPIWNAYPPAEVFGIVFNSDEEKARQLIKTNYQLIASELSELGINVNCAPVIDLSEKRGHSVIGDRALSSDPKTVGLLGKAVIDGLEKEGSPGLSSISPDMDVQKWTAISVFRR